EAQREAANALHRVGTIQWKLGRLEQALADLRQASARLEELHAAASPSPTLRHDLARARCSFSGLLDDRGQMAEAERLARLAVAAGQELVAEFPAEGSYRHTLATSHNRLGIVLIRTGRRPLAEAEYRASLAQWPALA